jgi:hypothetical protein
LLVASAIVLPLVSFIRQYAAGASARTVAL